MIQKRTQGDEHNKTGNAETRRNGNYNIYKHNTSTILYYTRKKEIRLSEFHHFCVKIFVKFRRILFVIFGVGGGICLFCNRTR